MDNTNTELELLDLEIMYPNEMLLDYINHRKPMSHYFPPHHGKLHHVKYTGNRSILQEVLLEYNKSIDAHDNVLANIELLGNENTSVVVTGQQPGLFTGPMYTIYKTFAAINYAHGWLDSGVRLSIFKVKDNKLITVK